MHSKTIKTLTTLHTDETGSQAMEYGALAAGGCGLIGVLVQLLSSETVQDRLSGVVTGVIDQLGTMLGGVF